MSFRPRTRAARPSGGISPRKFFEKRHDANGHGETPRLGSASLGVTTKGHRLAHVELDRAVLAAYAAVDADGDWAEDWADVWEETGAGQPLPEGHDLAEERAETDGRVLAGLLRLNRARVG